jgi:hypothetical protein
MTNRQATARGAINAGRQAIVMTNGPNSTIHSAQAARRSGVPRHDIRADAQPGVAGLGLSQAFSPTQAEGVIES